MKSGYMKSGSMKSGYMRSGYMKSGDMSLISVPTPLVCGEKTCAWY
jgi:hypothetical protein